MPAAYKFLEWDSAFFGHRIGRVAPAIGEPLDLAAVEAWRRANQVECLYCLVDPAERQTWRALEHGGFRFVDVRLTMRLETAQLADVGAMDASLALRPATTTDIPALRALAAESHAHTRFANDGRFARDRCRELYATWIEQSCREAATQVWVAELNGQLAGYCAGQRPPNAPAQIGLLAVAAAAQRRGVGRALLLTSLHALRARGAETVSVVTQGGNLPAYNLYRQGGFHAADWGLWYHGWFHD